MARGWHATCTLGTMGAAAAAAHLRGFDVETTRHALGCAASHASGVHANFGTMTKPLHAGLAPEARPSSGGARGGGPHGEHDHPGSPARIPGRLRRRRLPMRRGDRGESRASLRAGGAGHEHEALPVLSIDPPGGGCALRPWWRSLSITAADVARIEVSLVETATQVLRYHAPQTGLQGKFLHRVLPRAHDAGW